MADFNDSIHGKWTEPAPFVYLYNSEKVKGSSKIAAFDMDNTLIQTASGELWPLDKDDWKFLLPSVPEKLRALHRDGFKVVIFTNQASISCGEVIASDVQLKLEAIIKEVGIPMQAMIAGCPKGMFRKPLPGMWIHICTEANNGVKVDLSSCFFVGDAAGRVSNWKPGKKKDFSNCDRLFALNAGISFSTPEPFYNGEKEGDFEIPRSNPKIYFENIDLLEPKSAKLRIESQDMILMVGFPGSGKSHFSRRYLHGYRHVDAQVLVSPQQCITECERGLNLGKSLVIDDNANSEQQSRAVYIEMAKKYKVPVRCFVMSTSYIHARHNRVYRQLTNSEYEDGDDTAVNFQKNKYKEPKISEGFTEVVKANIVPEFDNEEHEKLYSMYLLVNDIYTPPDILPTTISL